MVSLTIINRKIITIKLKVIYWHQKLILKQVKFIQERALYIK